MTVLQFPPLRQRRHISVTPECGGEWFRVGLFPPCRHSNVDRVFHTSGDAVDYATLLAVQHHFPIHSPGIADWEWEAAIQETRDAM